MRRVRKKNSAKPRQRTAAADIILPDGVDSAGAFRAVAAALLRLIAAHQPAVRRRDPAGVHQMRIALRRMRAAITIFTDLVDGRDTERLKRELKWLAGRMAPARDLQLLELKLNSAQFGGASPAFLKRLAADRAAAFDEAKATVEQPRFGTLLHDLGRWIEAGDWTRHAADDDQLSAKAFAKHLLTRRARRLNKRLTKLERLDADARHRIRIAAKKLNYAIGFFESLFEGHPIGQRLERFRKHLKKLLDALGILNDVAVHRDLASKFARRPRAKLDPDAAKRLSDLDDAEISQQMKAAVKAAAKLADDRLFGD
jgi:CHAD domain-containing protein